MRNFFFIAQGLNVGRNFRVGRSKDADNTFEEQTAYVVGHFEDVEAPNEDAAAGKAFRRKRIDALVEGVLKIGFVGIENCT